MERSVKADGRGVAIFGQHTFKLEASDSSALPAWCWWWTVLYNIVWPIFILPTLLSWFILSMIPSLALTIFIYNRWDYGTTMLLKGPLYLVYAGGTLLQLFVGKWILVSRFKEKSYKINSLYFLRRLAYTHCLDFAALFLLDTLKGTHSCRWSTISSVLISARGSTSIL